MFCNASQLFYSFPHSMSYTFALLCSAAPASARTFYHSSIASSWQQRESKNTVNLSIQPQHSRSYKNKTKENKAYSFLTEDAQTAQTSGYIECRVRCKSKRLRHLRTIPRWLEAKKQAAAHKTRPERVLSHHRHRPRMVKKKSLSTKHYGHLGYE